jgi:hypothetical protein
MNVDTVASCWIILFELDVTSLSLLIKHSRTDVMETLGRELVGCNFVKRGETSKDTLSSGK